MKGALFPFGEVAACSCDISWVFYNFFQSIDLVERVVQPEQKAEVEGEK